MSAVAVPRERRAGETRVAATPDTVAALRRSGLEVSVERGAGAGALISDDAYADAGATLVDDPAELFAGADLLLKVGPPSEELDSGETEASHLREGSMVVGLLAAHRHLEVVRALADRKVTAFALEQVPRVAKAQSMDALSSQDNVAGYRAALLAAGELPRFFPLLMTAAGTVTPARVLVVGAGVAGLQAIATARRLGALVKATDIRAEAAEQVTSLGAEFVDTAGVLEAGDSGDDSGNDDGADQQRRLGEAVADADVVITAALVPGKPAPTLVTGDMVEGMRPGSVVVDASAVEGGNCEPTRPDETVTVDGVRVFGPTDLPSQAAPDASQLYATNVAEFVGLLTDSDGGLRVDTDEELVQEALLVADGSVVHEPTAAALDERST